MGRGQSLTRVAGFLVIGAMLIGCGGDVTDPGLDQTPASGSLDTTFDPGTGTDGSVWTMVEQPDGRIIIVGNFTTYNGISRRRIARLHPDGNLDTGFDPGFGANDSVYALCLLPSGKIMIGGNFQIFDGMPRVRIARLNPDGSLDGSFDPGEGANGQVMAIALHVDGRLLIAGSFSKINGVDRGMMARIFANGQLDTSFLTGTGFNALINAMLRDEDSTNYLVGGSFTDYSGFSINRIARVDRSTGLRDASFTPGTGANNAVWSLARHTDGHFLVGGAFTQYDGAGRRGLMRITGKGVLDTAFATNAQPDSGTVYSMTVQPDSRILVGGSFTVFSGAPRGRIVRLHADGSLDEDFPSGTGADDQIYKIIRQADGKILIGGRFSEYNGTPRRGIARLYP
jgi:uncharacterized delta-60 repeat protein